MSEQRVVLVGNPNCGKTALFNALTGSHQRVGNWSGVTVEKKSGAVGYKGKSCQLVDLPGIYSLFSGDVETALDEKIACNFLVEEPIDVVVNVLDATNLERHLYLTTQLLDLGIPVVVAVNMMDIAKLHQLDLDLHALARGLQCPVVGVSAHRGDNVFALKHALFAQLETPCYPRECVQFPAAVTRAKKTLVDLFRSEQRSNVQTAFCSMSALEGNWQSVSDYAPEHVDNARDRVAELAPLLQEEVDLVVADRRYRWARWLSGATVKSAQSAAKRQTWTQRIDGLVLNRWLGFPIFLLVMYALFFFAINVGGAFQDFFDQGSDALCVQGVAHLLQQWHAPSWLVAVLADGVGKGINTTVTFIPIIAALFFFLSFLEDSGYMARATFLMDRIMRFLGLPGEAFVPMIVGFGCNVPAVMGARTLSKPRDRVLTVMMMPFMACSARFAIFTVFAAAFFPHTGALLIFSLYLIGIIAAVGTGLLLRKTCLSGKSAPLVMELPNYHRPQFSVLCRLMWRRARSFVLRAGKVIIPVSIILGGLNAITIKGSWENAGARTSALSVVGQWVTPVFAPMGIKADNWPATVGLATGVMAKEVVIGTLNSLYAEQTDADTGAFDLGQRLWGAVMTIPQNLVHLAKALANPVVASAANVSMDSNVLHVMQQRFGSTAAAFSYLLFVLLYFPCVSTMAVMQREVGRRWAVLSMGWSVGLAYAAAVMCYQLWTITQHPLSALWSMVGILGVAVASLWAWRRYVRVAELEGMHVTGS
jgi:ferrous iron transport protein B